MLMEGLNDRQRRFCEEYVIDLDRERAAIAASYSADTAYAQGTQLLQKLHVIEYVSLLQKQRALRSKINSDYVLEVIAETIERSRGLTVTEIDDEGNPKNIKEYKYDPKNALKGAELIGKHLAMFTDVTESKLTFTQMGSVVVGKASEDGKIEATKELTFEVGSEPNNVPS